MTTANVRSQLDRKLRDAFREIIDGKSVKRSKHELHFGGIDVSNIFIEEMEKRNFIPGSVASVSCRQGMRVPAFVLEGSSAYFGWIFWENFTEKQLRKLFGSVLRNERGDWAIQIPEGSQRIVFANPGQALEMETDHPFGW